MALDFRKEFAVDKNLEEQGSKMELDEETYLFVRPTTYIPYRNAFAKEVTKNRRSLKKPGAIDAFNKKVNTKLVAEYLVTGWEGELTDGDKVLNFSSDVMADLFQRYPNLLDEVLVFAADLENYREEVIQELANELRVVPSS